MRERGQVLGACYSPTRHRPLAPSLCHPTPGRQLSAAGAHLSQPGERREPWKGAGVACVPTLLPLLAAAFPRRGAGRAHSNSSAVRAASCVGTPPVRWFEPSFL